jgi:hypothetical protein
MRWQAVAILFLSLLMGSCNKLFISNLSKISLPDSLYTELKSYTDSHRVLLYSPSAPISSALLVRNQVYSQAFFRDFDQQDFMHRALVYKRLPGDSLSVLLCPKGMRFDQASLLPYTLYQDFQAPKKMGLTNVVAPVAIGVAAAVGLSQGDLGSGLAGGLGILVFTAYQDLAGWAYGEMTNPNAYWNPNRVGPLLLARPDSVAADTLAIDTVRLPLPTIVPSLSHQTLSRIKKSQAWVRPQIWLATEYPLFSYRGVEMPFKGYGYPYRPSIHYSLGYSKSFREHWDWSIQFGLEHGLLRRYLYGPTPDKRGYQHASLASGPIWRKEGGTQHPWVFRLGFSAQLNYFMGWRSGSEFDWWPITPRGIDDTLVNTPSQLKMDTYVFTYNTERASLLPRLDFSYERRMSPHSSLALSASLQHYSGQLQYRVYSREWDFSQQGTVYTEKSSSGVEDLVTRYGVFNMGIRYIYHLNTNK